MRFSPIWRYALLGLVLAGVVGAIAALTLASPGGDDAAPSSGGPGELDVITGGRGGAVRGKPAPELAGIVAWINSEPLRIAGLRGKVVLVDFWTYTCVNCVRTFPFLKEWDEKYAGDGLVIISVHTPEFAFEKEVENVRAAARRYGLTYPIAVDSNRVTWDAFKNQYWPRKYLIDKNGVVRYDHIGEGRYEATEAEIKRLLAETGASVEAKESVNDPDPGALGLQRRVTPELYAGLRGFFSGQLGNFTRQALETPYDFTLPSSLSEHTIYLKGRWVQHEESIQHGRTTEAFEDEIVLRYWARSVNLVVRPERPEAFEVRVLLDGKPLDALTTGKDARANAQGESIVLVDAPRLYNLVSSPEPGPHELRLSARSDAFAIYAFTFGVGEQD